MTKQRNYSTEFKRQVVLEYLAGETLYGLSKRHDVSRNVIRLWIALPGNPSRRFDSIRSWPPDTIRGHEDRGRLARVRGTEVHPAPDAGQQ